MKKIITILFLFILLSSSLWPGRWLDDRVSTAGTTNNVYIHDVIGQKQDTASGNSIYSYLLWVKSFSTNSLTNSINNYTALMEISTNIFSNVINDYVSLRSILTNIFTNIIVDYDWVSTFLQTNIDVRQNKVYPTLANGQILTNNGIWSNGVTNVIVPRNSIAENFTIKYINIESAASNDTYEVTLFWNTNNVCSQVRFTIDTKSGSVLLPVSTPIIVASNSVNACVASSYSGIKTVTVSIIYNTY